uniref:Protein inturned n=1 Tax=Phallusia mammillata TaxID=59560 RepID=A0A6F9DFY5_9ASCI|nr:protein inturned-like [Phallusia mammillata]
MAVNMQHQTDVYRPVLYQKSNHSNNLQQTRQQQIQQRYESSDSENNSFSDSEYSEFSDDDEPAWNEEPMRAGELFYVEDNPESGDTIVKNGVPILNEMPLATGNLKNVFIGVNAASTYERKFPTNLLASMLGIITLDRKIKYQSTNESVVVDALVPGGISLRTGQVYVGDVLLYINDMHVSSSNIEHILRSFIQPSKLKLTFQSMEQQLHSHGVTHSTQELKSVSTVQLLSPNKKRQSQDCTLSAPNAIFFLTLNVHSETAGENDDVLYSYPPIEGSSTLPSKLALVRGLFVTLSDVIQDTFGSQVLSSSLIIEGKMVHCAYYHVKTEVLVLCLPGDNYSLPQVHHTLANTVRLLTVMYGSVLQAFLPENKLRLDHLFQFVLILNASSGLVSKALPSGSAWKFPGMEFLKLSPDLTAHANSALAELEACDFDDGSSGRNYTRRLYTIRGSCVFYDGHLLANHLPTSDLNDITLFCYNHSLLGLNRKERIGLLLIWREVFPWSSHTATQDKEQYIPSEGRCFWMFIGLKHTLLCVLLQMNGSLFPHSHTPRPDPMYVNKARATLLNLETCHFQDCVSQRLLSTSKPLLAQPDKFLLPLSVLKGAKPPSGSKQDKSIFPSFSSPLKSKQSIVSSGQASPQKLKKSQRDLSFGEKSPQISVKTLFRDKSFSSQGSDESGKSGKATQQASAYSLEDIQDAIDDVVPSASSGHQQLPLGAENTLFCYLTFNTLNGILIVPTAKDLNTVNSPLHQDIVKNFKKHCMILHQRFKSSKSSKEYCVEEGILFQCQKPSQKSEIKSKPPSVQYWVIGRSISRPTPKEVYVCFHNSAAQNMVELAFRMI